MKNKIVIPMFVVVILGAVLAIGAFSGTPAYDGGIGSSESVEYTGDVYIRHTDAEGNILFEERGHNVLYNTGKEAIEDYLADGGGGSDAFDWIELCNASSATGCGVPAADKSEAYLALAECGLSEVAGTVGDNSGTVNGNWSIWYEFTSTCDNVKVNVTRLRNADGDDLAGNSFTLATLQNGDKLLVNWTVWVT